MKYIVVSVRDRAADAYGRPFFVAALGQAIRSFTDEVNKKGPDNTIGSHPEDFDLYHLGTFDDATGTFECGTPRQIAIGKDVSLIAKAQ